MATETCRDVLATLLDGATRIPSVAAALGLHDVTPARILAASEADQRLIEAARRVAAARDAVDDAEPGSDHRSRCLREMHAAIDQLSALAGEDSEGL